MTHQKRLYQALKSECEANINEALLTLDMCMTKASSIGEHTSKHFLEEASKALSKLGDAEGRLNTLESYIEGSSLFNKKQLND